MFTHDQAFAIAKMRQAEYEADATARRLVKKSEEVAVKPQRQYGRLFARVRPA